jgi:hypothetical protein
MKAFFTKPVPQSYFRFLYSLLLAWVLAPTAQAQVGIGTATPDANAMLDITSASRSLLLPRMAGDPATTGGVNGYMYYNTTSNQIRAFQNGSWGPVSGAAGANLTLSNISTTSIPAGADLLFAANNSNNIGSLSNGVSNLYLSGAAGSINRGVWVGNARALTLDVVNANIFSGGGNSVVTGVGNNVVGFGAGIGMTATANNNSIFGYNAGGSVTSGNNNVLIGSSAGGTLSNGAFNVVVGSGANVASGISNAVAVGSSAASAQNAVAIGASTQALGTGSLALGTGAQTTAAAASAASILAGVNGTPNLIAIGTASNTTSFAGNVGIGASTAARASLTIATGVTPTTPATGDLWVDASGNLFYKPTGAAVNLSGGGSGLATNMSNIDPTGVVQDIRFVANTNRTFGILQSPLNTSGANLTITGAHAGTGLSPADGGDITLQLGNGNGTTGSRLGSVIINTNGSPPPVTSINYDVFDVNPSLTIGGSNFTRLARVRGNGGSSPGTTVVGLDVDLTGGGFSSATRYAAFFNGGNVGIGTATPTAGLLDIRQTVATPALSVQNSVGPSIIVPATGGNVGIGTPTPSARLQLGAGSAAAGGAPFKLTGGTNLTTPELGALEFDGTDLYFTKAGPLRVNLSAGGGGANTTLSNLAVTTGINSDLTFNNVSSTRNITAAPVAAGTGVGITIAAGQTSNGFGGNLNIQASNGVGTNQSGGGIQFQSGVASTGTGNGGDMQFNLGSGGNTNPGQGGTFTVNGGGGNRGSNIVLIPGIGTTSNGSLGIGANPVPAALVSVGPNASYNYTSVTAMQIIPTANVSNTIRGLFVDISGVTGSPTNLYAATFTGGNVGIGANTPGFPLTVATSNNTFAASINNSGNTSSHSGLQVSIAGTSATPFDVQSNSVSRLTVLGSGEIRTASIHNNGGTGGPTAAAIASGNIVSGAQVFTNGNNCTPSTNFSSWNWMRVGNVVTVSGSAQANSVTTGSPTFFFDINLPITCSSTPTNLAGAASALGPTNLVAGYVSSISASTARITMPQNGAGNYVVYFTYTYTVQ